MTLAQKTLTAAALLLGVLTGGVCTHAAYWMDACVAGESGGYGASPDWVNRCRK
ncbi:MAG: hypothetical protein AB1679_09690 [Actinomycetota bacterium]